MTRTTGFAVALILLATVAFNSLPQPSSGETLSAEIRPAFGQSTVDNSSHALG